MTASPLSDRSALDSRWFVPLCCLGLAALAVLMGGPSLHGEFSSGDDVQLVRDNVLVNHPSIAHAVKLFIIPAHRDLYQPVALLSFQCDFALSGLLTFRGDPRVIHAQNIALHAVNAVLVFLFLRLWTGRAVVAALAGLLMAVHPINVEAVAWMNGRMMLLSTALCLAGLMAFEHWRRTESSTRRWTWLALSLFLFALTMMTKVRVELPGLLILLLVLQRIRPSRSWWIAWGAATGITLAFSVWALLTTQASEMFEMAAEGMRGPRLARAFQSLAWYFTHYLWPVDLGPWHPPQLEVAWLEGDIPRSVAIVLALLAAVAATWRLGPTGPLGMLWFLGAIFSTLQIVASRAILAGERYAYLPAIGLHWMTAAGFVWIVALLSRRMNRRAVLSIAAAAVLLVASVFLGIARDTCRHYRDSVSLARRIVELYPETSNVWVDLAWAYIRDGQYQQGIRHAKMQFQHAEPDECLIYQAVAWAQFRQGHAHAAEESLLRARRANPEYSKVYHRLAEIYLTQDRLDEAETMYRKCVQFTPLYLPAQSALARLFLDRGRLDEAEERYLYILEQVNPYHPDSRYNLGDIYMTQGRHDLARAQYERLLSYMPEHAMARANLALCLQRQGDLPAALESYDQALLREPGLLAARLNRAALLARLGREPEALNAYRAVLAGDPAQRQALLALSESLLAANQGAELSAVWKAALRAEPESPDLLAAWAWVLCRTDDYAAAVAPAQRALKHDEDMTLAFVAMGIARHRAGDFLAAAKIFESVAANHPLKPADTFERYMVVLAGLSEADPDSPWPYYYTALLLAAQGRHEAADMGLREFEKLCQDAEPRRRAREVLSRLRPDSAK